MNVLNGLIAIAPSTTNRRNTAHAFMHDRRGNITVLMLVYPSNVAPFDITELRENAQESISASEKAFYAAHFSNFDILSAARAFFSIHHFEVVSKEDLTEAASSGTLH